MSSTPLDLIARVILLLVTAFLVNIALRRQSASLRALVWTLALGGLLLLPALSRLTPRLRLGVLPAAIASPTQSPALKADIPVGDVPLTSTRRAGGSGTPAPTQTIVLQNSPTGPSHDPARPLSWVVIALGIWVTGCGLLMLRLLNSARALNQIVRRATVPADPRWVLLVERVRDELGIRRVVEVRVSDAVTIPAIAGAVRPVLLLPPDAVEWGEAERRQVVLHELAHVARWDGLSQLVTQGACAFYWFIPLVWYGARRAAELRELACDDVVLNAGTRASTYAENLLKLVSMAGAVELPPSALAMARGSRLHHRVKGILDPGVQRGAVSGRATLTLMALAGGVFGLVAAMDPAARATVDPFRSGMGAALVEAPSTNGVSADPSPPRLKTISGLGEGLKNSDTTGFCSQGIRSSSSSINEDDDHNRSWKVKVSGSDCKVDMVAEGKIEFNDDFTDVKSISSGGFFRLDVTDHGVRRRLEIEPRNGTLERDYRVNDNAHPWDEEGRRWFAAFLIELDRRTAIAVDIRLPQLLHQGGVSAVLDETGRMPSDYARSQYYTRLATTTKLSSADVRRILEQAASLKTSDYYASELLKAFLGNGVEDPVMREAVLGMVNKMTSDYYRAEAMDALFASGRPTPAEVNVLLTVVGRMESSYYQAETLKKLLALSSLTSAQRAMVASTVAGMKDDYQVAEVLKVLVAKGEMGPDERKALFDALGHVQSDYYLYEITHTMLTDHSPTTDETDLVIRAAGRMTSDYYRGEMVSDLLGVGSLSERDLLGVVELVRAMESDYTKGEVLQKVLRHRSTNPKVRQAVLDVAGTLSDYYRGEVRQAAGRGDI